MTQAVIQVAHVTPNIAGSAATATATLPTSMVTANCVPWVNYEVNSGGDQAFQNLIPRASFLTGPNRLQMERNNNGSNQLNIEANVIEFDPEFVTVQFGTTTIANGSSSATGTITAVVKANSFLVMSFQVTGNSGPQHTWAKAEILNTTTVSFERTSTGSGSDIIINWWVVEDITQDNRLWSVQHFPSELMDALLQQDVTITAVTVDKTFVLSSGNHNGSGNMRAAGNVRLLDSTTVQLNRDGSGADWTVSFQVVELKQTGDVVQRGAKTNLSGTDISQIAVDPFNISMSVAAPVAMAVSFVQTEATSRRSAPLCNLRINSPVELEMESDDGSNDTTLTWQVIQFHADFHRAVVATEHVDLTMEDGNDFATFTLLEGISTANASLVVSARAEGSTDEPYDDLFIRARFLTAPDRVQIERDGTGVEINCRIDVIYWDTDNVLVQTSNSNITAGNDTQTSTITAVVLDRTFLVSSALARLMGDSNRIDSTLARVEITNTTTVTTTREGSPTNATLATRFYVVEDITPGNYLWRVQAFINQVIASIDIVNVTIEEVDLTKSFIHASQFVDGGTPNSRPAVAFLTSSTNLRLERSTSASQPTSVSANVIELRQVGDLVQSGSIAVTSPAREGDDTLATPVGEKFVFFSPTMQVTGVFTTAGQPNQLIVASVHRVDSTTVRAQTEENGGSSVQTVKWQAVRFDDGGAQKAIFFGMNF